MKEWRKLDPTLRDQFRKKLETLRLDPHVSTMRVSGWRNVYRIKLRKAGYRLGYRVLEDRVVIMVITVEKRDKDKAYRVLEARLRLLDD